MEYLIRLRFPLLSCNRQEFKHYIHGFLEALIQLFVMVGINNNSEDHVELGIKIKKKEDSIYPINLSFQI